MQSDEKRFYYLYSDIILLDCTYRIEGIWPDFINRKNMDEAEVNAGDFPDADFDIPLERQKENEAQRTLMAVQKPFEEDLAKRISLDSQMKNIKTAANDDLRHHNYVIQLHLAGVP